jgi:hypothetical protein
MDSRTKSFNRCDSILICFRVEVVLDTWGGSHIRARDTHDLFFAHGFIVAQDRMLQMDLWRRSAEGRLAVVLGPKFIARDKFARSKSPRRVRPLAWTRAAFAINDKADESAHSPWNPFNSSCHAPTLAH